jgi:hypothetical protein
MLPNMILFYGEEFLASCLTPKLEDHTLPASRDCLFNIFAATLHNRGCSSIRNLRTRQVVVTKAHLWEIMNNRENYIIRRDNWFNAKYLNLTTIR